MTRCFLAAIFLALFASSYSAADDYLLRLETVDLRVLPNGDKEVTGGTPESIEIVVRDRQTFFGSTTIQGTKVTISGSIQESQGNQLLVDIHYRRSKDTGKFVPGKNGAKHPIRKSLVFDSKARWVEMGKQVILDAPISQAENKRLTLAIESFDPARKQE